MNSNKKGKAWLLARLASDLVSIWFVCCGKQVNIFSRKGTIVLSAYVLCFEKGAVCLLHVIMWHRTCKHIDMCYDIDIEQCINNDGDFNYVN